MASKSRGGIIGRSFYDELTEGSDENIAKSYKEGYHMMNKLRAKRIYDAGSYETQERMNAIASKYLSKDNVNGGQN